MTFYVVSSGVTSTGLTLGTGDALYVYSGGSIVSTTMSGDSSGSEVDGSDAFLSGGTAISTTVRNGGRLFVSSGATTSFTTLSGITSRGGDGLQVVFYGGTAISTIVDSGGTEQVYGGTVISTTVDSGGTEQVGNGKAIGTTVSGGGTEYVYDRAIGTTVDSGGAEVVGFGGSPTYTTVSSGGYLVVLPGGTQSFTTVSAGGAIVSTGVVTVQPGSGVTVYQTTAAGAVLDSGGAEYILSGYTASNTTVNFGAQEFVYPGGTADSTTVNGGGFETVSSSGAASLTTVNSGGFETVFTGGSAEGTTVSSGGTEVIYFDDTAVSTTVELGGMIDLVYHIAEGGTVSVSSGDELTVSWDTQSYTQQLAGSYADTHFELSLDHGYGTLLTLEAGAPCYCRGTRILTARGEVAIEALRVGDRVRTELNEAWAPIIWIGQREADCARHPQPRRVWPVRIAADALGPGRPHSELFLSPDHAVYVNEVLIPIRYLINGSTIVQVTVDRVSYYHIELEQHDVVLAQGLPAESFLDMRDGTNYANRPGPIRLYPDFSARMWEAFGCARLVVTGPELAAARALVGRFAAERDAA